LYSGGIPAWGYTFSYSMLVRFSLMSDLLPSTTDIVQEAMRILEAAQAERMPLRLLGGLAIALRCPGVQSDKRLQRNYADMDFAILSQSRAQVKALFSSLKYSGKEPFNSLHGYQRLIFSHEEHGSKIDIFVDRLQMCHTIDLRKRLHIHDQTLSLADLLLTKLQIVEINEKDITDALALLCDHSIVENEQGIHGRYIAHLTAQDWGLYKTCTLNILRGKYRSVLRHCLP
jgi:hypothetical protein